MHHTKSKADIAATKAISDLTTKGYSIFTAVVCEHLPFDFIAYRDGKCYRIQAKYASKNLVNNISYWTDSKGNHQKKYKVDDFEFYAVYLSDIDQVVYPSAKFGGCHIATKLPNSPTLFYWWEDFIDLTENASKRSYKEFGVDLKTRKVNPDARMHTRKVKRPFREELEKLVWKKPTVQIAKDFGVSGKAIEKWCKGYEIDKPPRGYWMKKNCNKPSDNL